MTLQHRIALLSQLGKYMNENGLEWQEAKQKAASCNAWFVPEFIDQASQAINSRFLQKEALQQWTESYNLHEVNARPKLIGLVMAGNLPMVGFHDMLCIFITGHYQHIKLSSKDDVLIKHLVSKMCEWDEEISRFIFFADKISGCDVYIATGSNNSGRYFEYYFGRYPHIIRRNRTSVAVLDGTENTDDLFNLADDVQMYFGLGCRNVTKLYVPVNYDFVPLLRAFDKYAHFMDYHKYRHNYDYQLALLMMANKKYMTNGSILLSEHPGVFTAISQVHFETYTDITPVEKSLKENEDLQCIIGKNYLPFGLAQTPKLNDYADGVDTISFLSGLK